MPAAGGTPGLRGRAGGWLGAGQEERSSMTVLSPPGDPHAGTGLLRGGRPRGRTGERPEPGVRTVAPCLQPAAGARRALACRRLIGRLRSPGQRALVWESALPPLGAARPVSAPPRGCARESPPCSPPASPSSPRRPHRVLEQLKFHASAVLPSGLCVA